jgi:hypothetical protein
LDALAVHKLNGADENIEHNCRDEKCEKCQTRANQRS